MTKSTKAHRPTLSAKVAATGSQRIPLPTKPLQEVGIAIRPARCSAKSPTHAGLGEHDSEHAIEKQVDLFVKALRSRKFDLLPTSLKVEVILLNAALLAPQPSPADLARELRRELRLFRKLGLEVTGDDSARRPLVSLFAASDLPCPICGSELAARVASPRKGRRS